MPGTFLRRMFFLLAHLCLFCSVAQAQTVVNVQSYGALGNGSDATAAIAEAITHLPPTGGTLFFPPGNYVISGTNFLPSNTRMLCEKAVIIAAPAQAWTDGITIAFGATSGANFEIAGCQFKFPYGNPHYGHKYAHILQFVGVSHVNIHNNIFDGGGDAVADIGTIDTWETANSATNVSNACYDHWGGFADAHTNGNFCTTLPTAGHGVGGIQFTGIASGGAPANSLGFEARNNFIQMNNGNSPQCFEINGHKEGGTDDRGIIIGNHCVVTGGNAVWGILVTGHSTSGEIADNILENGSGGYSAVGIFSPAANWNVHDNVAINWAAGRHNVFQNDGIDGTLVNNRLYGSCADAPESVRTSCMSSP